MALFSPPVVQQPAQVPAPKPVAPTTKQTSMKTTMMPGCCGLKVIHKVGCLGKQDAMSVLHTEAFDELTVTGRAQDGMWSSYGRAPETVVVISTSNRYHINDPEQKEFNRQVEFLKGKGWTCLASWLSEESGGTNYMWGSPGIKSGEVNCDRKKETK